MGAGETARSVIKGTGCFPRGYGFDYNTYTVIHNHVAPIPFLAFLSTAQTRYTHMGWGQKPIHIKVKKSGKGVLL